MKKIIVIDQNRLQTGILRKVAFNRSAQYAVVIADHSHVIDLAVDPDSAYAKALAKYHAKDGTYTTHRTAEAAIRQSRRVDSYSHLIVDRNGKWYFCDGESLRPCRV